MSFTLEAKIIEIADTEQITDKFRLRKFIVETSKTWKDKTYTETIEFEVVNDACDKLDAVSVGDYCEIQFDVKGRRGKGDYAHRVFNKLQAFKVAVLSDGDGTRKMGSETKPEKVASEAHANEQLDSDGLPF